MRKFEQYYVAFWCLTMPITSFILIPAVQGTTIAYMLGLGSIGFVLSKIRYGEMPREVAAYFKVFSLTIGLWLLLLCGSQIGNLLNRQLTIQNMFTISDENTNMFRASLFTQSLYLLACVMIGLYFRYFFQEAWIKYLYWGAWFFALYGLYDWTFFLVFHQSGDFIANRTFLNGDQPGSWSQTLNFGGVALLRWKSCLGEPSFVSVVVIPYLFMALEAKKMPLAGLILVSAVLTTSTTVFLGLAICIFIEGLWNPRSRKWSFAAFALLALAVVAMALIFPDQFRFIFENKISGDTESGQVRLKNFEDYKNLFGQFGLVNWIFGVGFGYLYFSLFWSLTANTGILGIGTYLYVLLKPAFLLPRIQNSAWLKISMVAILVVSALSLTELFIPTTWMFIGLAYRKLDQLKQNAARPARVRARSVDLKPALS